MKLKHDRDILDAAQLFITIVTAIVAVRLNYLQGELSRRIQREGITQTYAEKILSHLSDLKMDPEQRSTVVIDVLDIITAANLNSGEHPYSDSERQQLIPLRLALATHDADLIAHIGTDEGKRKLWTDMAIESGNNEIKRTAIRALSQIGRYRGRLMELKTFSFCVDKILEISENFARTPISQDAIEQFAVLVEVTGKVPILLEDPALKALMQRGRDALILVVGNAIKESADQPQVQPPEPAPPPPGKANAFQNTVGDGEADGLQTVVNRIHASLPIVPRAANSSGGSKTFLVASAFSAAQKALKQVDDLNLKKDIVKPASQNVNDLSSTINALKADDVETRRNARQELAKGGAANVPLLLAALRKEPDNYRMRFGVSFTLSRMTETVPITKSEDASLLVKLAGDDEPEVRQYASEFLMRLSGVESLKMIRTQFEESIEHEITAIKPNTNVVYNAVVIFGTWMRTLPSEFDDENLAIAKYLNELMPRLPKDGQWDKILTLINELNPTTSESKPLQN
jgi:hypothetical protein